MLLNFKKIMVISLMIFSMNFLHVTYSHADPAATGTTPSDPTDAGQGIANVLCNVIAVAQGATGKTIATLVIISMAIGLFLGKITWGVAIAVAVGMGVLFGANTVVSFISSSDGKGSGSVCPNNKP
ncbi:TrbC/VirB2 family protein [Candidatus Bandiella numerosa]|uniref:TrbC/VirB2 family protein n=1 Tax=Candidatus Bandiella numerosa TaxID=2570586 RepID=UPI00249EEB41|nr:TrbC/VirB2 family protein [Candidatus Bandiella numerosa]WHA04727.1 TrbC/VirB2 family protein [Candidatus Bandiella numerosa]